MSRFTDLHDDCARDAFLLAISLSEIEGDAVAALAARRRCPACEPAAVELDRWRQAVDHPDPRVWQEWATARSYLEVLLELPLEQRSSAVRSDRLLHQWGIAVYALQEDEPEIALTVALCLDPDFYGGDLVADLRARCWLAAAGGGPASFTRCALLQAHHYASRTGRYLLQVELALTKTRRRRRAGATVLPFPTPVDPEPVGPSRRRLNDRP